ncbi:collagen alpha-1(III) chain-like [Pseudopipra pipra]|uniref:collagen alpha-1(III) chain-like n=1 Tax=Pseudopipra pipra TaxID=415032 RepID=UPI0031393F47
MAGGRAGPAAPEEGTEAAGGLYGGGGGSVAGQCGTLRAGAGGDGGRRGAAPRPAGGAGGPRSAARAPAAGRGAGAGGGGSARRSGGGEGAPAAPGIPPPPPGPPRPPAAAGGAPGGRGRGEERGRSLPPGGQRGARRRAPAGAGGARAPGRARTKRRRGGRFVPRRSELGPSRRAPVPTGSSLQLAEPSRGKGRGLCQASAQPRQRPGAVGSPQPLALSAAPPQTSHLTSCFAPGASTGTLKNGTIGGFSPRHQKIPACGTLSHVGAEETPATLLGCLTNTLNRSIRRQNQSENLRSSKKKY